MNKIEKLDFTRLANKTKEAIVIEIINKVNDIIDAQNGENEKVEGVEIGVEEFNFGNSLGSRYTCPSCKNMEVSNRHRFCPNCGVKIKWNI